MATVEKLPAHPANECGRRVLSAHDASGGGGQDLGRGGEDVVKSSSIPPCDKVCQQHYMALRSAVKSASYARCYVCEKRLVWR